MEKLFYLLLLSIWVLAGCSKSASEAPKVEAGSKPKSMPSLAGLSEAPGDIAQPPAPEAANTAVNAPANGATPMAGTVSAEGGVNGVVLTRDEEGKVLTGEQILYKAIEIYVEGKGKPWPSDPNELVREGVLKSLPPAPAGKKWAVDNKKYKVVLENL